MTPAFFLLTEAHAATHAAEPTLMEYILHSNVINVLIVAVVLVVLMKKFNVGSAIDDQQQAIAKSLKDAEDKREKALTELADIQKRLSNLDGEVAAMLTDAEETAQTVADSIIKNAEKEAKKIKANATKQMELERNMMVRTLEKRLSYEAIHAAEELLESTMSDSDRVKSVEAFVESLPDLIQKETSS